MSKRARPRKNLNYRRNQRREAADKRQELHNQLSTQEKINKLDNRFGKDKGAKKERKKLEDILSDT